MEETHVGFGWSDRPESAKATVLTVEEEAIIVAFRRHTLLPLEDCLYSLQSSIAHPLPGRRLRSIRRVSVVVRA